MIKSTPFGSTVVTGKDARRFMDNLGNPPNEKAREAVRRVKRNMTRRDL